MSGHDAINLRFKLIAAKAELMTENRLAWTDEVRAAAQEISKLAGEILDEARQYDGSDR